MSDRESEHDDRAARGLRIFEALRRGRTDDASTATAVQDPPAPPGVTSPPSEPPVSEVAPEPEPEPEPAAAAVADEDHEEEQEDPEEEASGPLLEPAAALPGADVLDAQLQAPPPVVNEPPPVVTPPPPIEAPPRTAVTVAPPSPGEVQADAVREETVEAEDAQADAEEAQPAESADEAILSLPRVIAIANQKGGVGKTTTAVNLSAALTELDYRVLVIDLDPQGNATTGVGVDIRNLDTTVYEALMADLPLEDCIEPTSVRNLFVAPSNMDLAGAEIELVPMFSRELKLRRAIDGVKVDYDFILIDCPPSLGLLTVNGLAAADDVIVPIQCEYYALEGLGQLVNNVNLVRANLNPVLDIRGIVLTMYDGRTKLADQVVDEVRRHFGPKVFRTVVPRTVRLSEAPSFGQPIIVFDSHSRGSDAYRGLARELAERVEGGVDRIAATDGTTESLK